MLYLFWLVINLTTIMTNRNSTDKTDFKLIRDPHWIKKTICSNKVLV